MFRSRISCLVLYLALVGCHFPLWLLLVVGIGSSICVVETACCSACCSAAAASGISTVSVVVSVCRFSAGNTVTGNALFSVGRWIIRLHRIMRFCSPSSLLISRVSLSFLPSSLSFGVRSGEMYMFPHSSVSRNVLAPKLPSFWMDFTLSLI